MYSNFHRFFHEMYANYPHAIEMWFTGAADSHAISIYNQLIKTKREVEVHRWNLWSDEWRTKKKKSKSKLNEIKWLNK